MITLQFAAEYFRDVPKYGIGYIPKATGSAIIRLGDTWAEDSHVDDIQPNGKWLGARLSGGVQARDPYPVSYAVRIDVWVPDEQAYYDYLLAQVGKPYDILGVVGFIPREDWRQDNKWFCSELIAAALMHANPALRPLFSQASRISPATLHRDLRSYMAGLTTNPPSGGFSFSRG